MTDAVTVYRWDDVGAPSLASRKPSDLMKILKACLIDGYGSKQPLGWSIVEDEVLNAMPYLSLRNAGTSGVITLAANSDSASEYCRVQSYQEYVDKSIKSKASYYFDCKNNNSYTRGWVLIGTSSAFWFVQTSNLNRNYWNAYNGNSWMIFAGDIKSIYPTDINTFVQIAREGNGTSDRASDLFPYCLTTAYPRDMLLMSPLDNTNDMEAHSFGCAFGSGYFSIPSPNSDDSPQVNMLADLQILRGTSELMTSAQTFNDTTRPRLRGRLTGVKISDQSGWRSENFPVFKEINNTIYFQVPDGNKNASCVWINTEAW